MGTTYTQVQSQCSRSRHRNGVSEQILIYGAVSIADVWYFFFLLLSIYFLKLSIFKKKKKINFGALVLICLKISDMRLYMVGGFRNQTKYINVYFPALHFSAHHEPSGET